MLLRKHLQTETKENEILTFLKVLSEACYLITTPNFVILNQNNLELIYLIYYLSPLYGKMPAYKPEESFRQDVKINHFLGFLFTGMG